MAGPDDDAGDAMGIVIGVGIVLVASGLVAWLTKVCEADAGTDEGSWAAGAAADDGE